ncbi:hypothetical protein Q9295_15210 [Xinfangfangia sp. CPCC 101601]|uniref:Uncharacterized protein n=1 Tax=Pseudogemmobacter lacusdianii TaxID=3069608 RepID=A0ABU0W176_9RHOB|nr:hypothetical protein [Xinfangfangia sp. CPCC 101601]MDQ2067724.1 hypothetical protein [Xinfangfangia sp. CPCC 101601]
MSRQSKPGRPKIWVDGQQNPRFELRAFAGASLHFARGGMGRLLNRCAIGQSRFADQVGSGRWRVPSERLGRSGRFLPSVERTASALHFMADLLDRAGAHVTDGPQGEAPQPMDLSPRFTAPLAAAATKRPAPEPQPASAPEPVPIHTEPAPLVRLDDSDLLAIRSAIAASQTAPPKSGPSKTAQAPVVTDIATAAHLTSKHQAARSEASLKTRETALRYLSPVLGYALLVLALPYGAALAILAHLNGQDLRDL